MHRVLNARVDSSARNRGRVFCGGSTESSPRTPYGLHISPVPHQPLHPSPPGLSSRRRATTISALPSNSNPPPPSTNPDKIEAPHVLFQLSQQQQPDPPLAILLRVPQSFEPTKNIGKRTLKQVLTAITSLTSSHHIELKASHPPHSRITTTRSSKDPNPPLTCYPAVALYKTANLQKPWPVRRPTTSSVSSQLLLDSSFYPRLIKHPCNTYQFR
ncbi:hypothetical protein PGTUg99_000138 [Puccinia graminis f. sp. tritici]|uniref:Uncharacterized protein n=1 Tax=Puccinia graminis f. sp. tritici TaxID=56615 RepID=A0A5B0RJW4_PUCGR|nr:hypothetical protein PGTUg99_000138 [Puccinia graminis f. sp. tritici]